MTIKEVLASLDDGQRHRIMIAFDSEISHHVEYSHGKFIGVHLPHPASNLTVTARAGCWCIGEIRHVDSVRP